MSIKVTWRKLMNRDYIKVTGNGDEYLWLDHDEAIQLIATLRSLLLTPPAGQPDNDTDGKRM